MKKVLPISMIHNSRWGPTCLYFKKNLREEGVTYLTIYWLTGQCKRGSHAGSVTVALCPWRPTLLGLCWLWIEYISKVVYEKVRESESAWAWLANLKKNQTQHPVTERERWNSASQSLAPLKHWILLFKKAVSSSEESFCLCSLHKLSAQAKGADVL